MWAPVLESPARYEWERHSKCPGECTSAHAASTASTLEEQLASESSVRSVGYCHTVNYFQEMCRWNSSSPWIVPCMTLLLPGCYWILSGSPTFSFLRFIFFIIINFVLDYVLKLNLRNKVCFTLFNFLFLCVSTDG